MLIPASLAMNWNETERFGLFFTKMLVFMPKSGSINSGTGLLARLRKVRGDTHVFLPISIQALATMTAARAMPSRKPRRRGWRGRLRTNRM